jgi:hypothetical protein
MLWEGRHKPCSSYEPFAEWFEVEDIIFSDLIQMLMNLDPSKRITTPPALEHPQFKDVEQYV